MSLFSFNPFRASEELTPPILRSNSIIAFLRVLLRPVKWNNDRFINNYCQGSTYDDYDNATNYVLQDRVVWQDGGVYELMVSASVGIPPTGNALSATNWYRIAVNFIGADERARYNGQLIVFEYALNRWFRIDAPPYIYCDPTTFGSTQSFITINVPNAVYTALGPNDTARDNRVAEFASKYVTAGRVINVVPY